jgi:hypothetical protein
MPQEFLAVCYREHIAIVETRILDILRAFSKFTSTCSALAVDFRAYDPRAR